MGTNDGDLDLGQGRLFPPDVHGLATRSTGTTTHFYPPFLFGEFAMFTRIYRERERRGSEATAPHLLTLARAIHGYNSCFPSGQK